MFPGLCPEGGRLGHWGAGTWEPLGGVGGWAPKASNEVEVSVRRSPEPLVMARGAKLPGTRSRLTAAPVTEVAWGARSPSVDQTEIQTVESRRRDASRLQGAPLASRRWHGGSRRTSELLVNAPLGASAAPAASQGQGHVCSALLLLGAVGRPCASPVPLRRASSRDSHAFTRAQRGRGETDAARRPRACAARQTRGGSAQARAELGSPPEWFGLTEQVLQEPSAPAWCRSCRLERQSPP